MCHARDVWPCGENKGLSFHRFTGFGPDHGAVHECDGLDVAPRHIRNRRRPFRLRERCVEARHWLTPNAEP